MMDNSQRYTVRTHWGCFSLDEGAYQDYLAGKLWISWQPEETVVRAPGCVRREDVSEEAASLRDLAGRWGLWPTLLAHFSGCRVQIPYKAHLGK